MARDIEQENVLIDKIASLTGVDAGEVSQVLWLFGQGRVGVPSERRKSGALPRAVSRSWGPARAAEILQKIASNDDALDVVMAFASADHHNTTNPRLIAFNNLSAAEKRNSARHGIQEVIRNLPKMDIDAQ